MNTTENTTFSEEDMPTPEGQITQADIDRQEAEKTKLGSEKNKE